MTYRWSSVLLFTSLVSTVHSVSHLDCTFERGYCSWTNDTSGDFYWSRHNGSTASSETGPSVDHTYETTVGHYIYIETSSPRSSGDVARILSAPLVDPNTTCLKFWFHMYGNDISTLNVYQKYVGGTNRTLWTHRGRLDDKWYMATVDVNNNGSMFQIGFEGVRGLGYAGDIALDDISLTYRPCSNHTCPYGYFGIGCNYTCPINCFRPTYTMDVCNALTGSCIICNSGYYGDNCEHSCPGNCSGYSCKKNGDCTSCHNGTYGVRCEKVCPSQCTACSMLGECLGCKRIYSSGSYHQYWGPNCTNNCSSNCEYGSCNTITGECSGCSGRFWGSHCDQECPVNCSYSYYSGYTYCRQASGECYNCLSGSYGDYCNQSCGHGCQTCYSSGRCSYCKSGYHGTNCEYPCTGCSGSCNRNTGACYSCIAGKWGAACDKNCPANCRLWYSYDGCDQDYGDCDNCVNGYFGRQCNQTCPRGCDYCYKYNGQCQSCVNGFYGVNCSNHCPQHCEFKTCSQSTGYCYRCESGYYGYQKCDRECPRNCETCEIHSGTCLLCKPGFYEKGCTQVCSEGCPVLCSNATGYCSGDCIDGFWGRKCNNSCGPGCAVCNKFSGTCSKCAEGRWGPDCQSKCPINCKSECDMKTGDCTECDADKWGINCQFSCSSNCRGTICDDTQGHCKHGCEPGWWGDKCGVNCVNCKYTVDTDNEKLEDVCDRSTGYCTAGCESGKYGERCTESCSQNCAKSECGRQTGACIQGCKKGYSGSTCTDVSSGASPSSGTPSSGTPSSGTPSSGMPPGVEAAIVVGAVLFVAIIALIIGLFYWRRRSHGLTNSSGMNYVPGSNTVRSDSNGFPPYIGGVPPAADGGLENPTYVATEGRQTDAQSSQVQLTL